MSTTSPPADAADPGRMGGTGAADSADLAERSRVALGRVAAAQRLVRWQPSRRSVVGIAAAMVIAAVLSLAWLQSSRPASLTVATVAGSGEHTTAVSLSPSSRPSLAGGMGTATSATPAASSSRASVTTIVVDVAGKVRHPGIYRLPAEARVDDALKAAGGALPGVATEPLNLAAKLSDGQQIAVGVPGVDNATQPGGVSAAGGTGLSQSDSGGSRSGQSGAGSGGGSGSSAGLVNINTASSEQLQALAGVGPVLAQHIVDWRGEHGSFTSVQQLREVSGIGPAKFSAIRAHVTL